MNIRRRLQVSNLLMIVVPVGVGLVVGLVLIVGAWALVTGSGVGRDDFEEFSYEASAAAELAGRIVSEKGAPADGQDLSSLEQVLSANGLSAVVTQGGETLYSFGQLGAQDEALLASVTGLERPICVSSGSRALAVRDVPSGGKALSVYVLGDVAFGSKHATKAVVVVGTAALVASLLVAALATNRFLTGFVLRHVTAPLDELVSGFDRVSEGDLAFRLPTSRDDEFASAYEDFNKMTARLEESAERERRATEQRRDLVVGLSHDLKSPLTSIRAYAEGLLDGIAVTPESRERYLRTILAKCDQMRGQLKKISLVFRMDAEVGEVAPRPLDLAGFVRTWADENHEACSLSGVELELAIPPEKEAAMGLADGELLARVLANLIDNCGKYARAGRPTCRVRLGVVVTAAGNDRAGSFSIVVEDDGPGVSDAELGRVFDLFWRADESRANPEEGSGVGLAVVERAMGRMGGSVRAERSESLGGLAITLSFAAASEGSASATRAALGKE